MGTTSCLPYPSCPIYRENLGVYMTHIGQVLSPFSGVHEADQPLPLSKNNLMFLKELHDLYYVVRHPY